MISGDGHVDERHGSVYAVTAADENAIRWEGWSRLESNWTNDVDDVDHATSFSALDVRERKGTSFSALGATSFSALDATSFSALDVKSKNSGKREG